LKGFLSGPFLRPVRALQLPIPALQLNSPYRALFHVDTVLINLLIFRLFYAGNVAFFLYFYSDKKRNESFFISD
jgi:hypothetical protein